MIRLSNCIRFKKHFGDYMLTPVDVPLPVAGSLAPVGGGSAGMDSFMSVRSMTESQEAYSRAEMKQLAAM